MRAWRACLVLIEGTVHVTTHQSDEELGRLRVGSSIGHGDQALVIVLDDEVFISKCMSIDALATCAIPCISTLLLSAVCTVAQILALHYYCIHTLHAMGMSICMLPDNVAEHYHCLLTCGTNICIHHRRFCMYQRGR